MASGRAFDTQITQLRQLGASSTVLQSLQNEAAQAWATHASCREATQRQNPSGQAKNGPRRERAPIACSECSHHSRRIPETACHSPASSQDLLKLLDSRLTAKPTRPRPAQHRETAGRSMGNWVDIHSSRPPGALRPADLQQTLQESARMVHEATAPGATQEADDDHNMDADLDGHAQGVLSFAVALQSPSTDDRRRLRLSLSPRAPKLHQRERKSDVSRRGALHDKRLNRKLPRNSHAAVLHQRVNRRQRQPQICFCSQRRRRWVKRGRLLSIWLRAWANEVICNSECFKASCGVSGRCRRQGGPWLSSRTVVRR